MARSKSPMQSPAVHVRSEDEANEHIRSDRSKTSVASFFVVNSSIIAVDNMLINCGITKNSWCKVGKETKRQLITRN